jgi:hypothetical protein
MAQETLTDVLARLHAVVQAQADALDAEDFASVAQAGEARDILVASLDLYQAADMGLEDRRALEQIAAIDQRLVASAQQGLDRASREKRTLFKGQGALQQYRRRGQALIGALHQLDAAR